MIKIDIFNTTYFKVPSASMFRSIEPHPVASTQDGYCRLALRLALIQTNHHILLIDTGFGDTDALTQQTYQIETPDQLETELQIRGFSPTAVTDVVLTHLHLDHCGGSLRMNQSAGSVENRFPNATYWLSSAQWMQATTQPQTEEGAYPVEKLGWMEKLCKLHCVDGPVHLFPELELRIFHGHTAGMLVPLIHTEKATTVFATDLIPCLPHLNPLCTSAYDLNPALASSEKQAFLEEARQHHYSLILQHDADCAIHNL